MRQTLKNHYAPLLWEKVTEKFNSFVKENFDEETQKKYKLPLTNFDIEITGPLYSYFYKEITGNKNEPVSGSNKIIHKHTFDTHLQNPPNGYSTTLNFYANFIGYQSFEDFAEKHPIEKGKIEKISPNAISNKYKLLFLLIPIFIFGFYFLFKNDFKSDKRLLPFEEEKKIYDFLEAAINAEYKTYQKCPAIDTSLLSKYYDKNCDDYYNSIFRVLTIHKEKALTIINVDNKSGYNLDYKNITALNNDTITVAAVESWDLFWFKPETMRYDSSRIRKNTFYNTYKILQKDKNLKIVKMKTDSVHRHFDWKKYVK